MRMSALLALSLLAACAEESPPDPNPGDVERDVALVEAANEALPPVRKVTPEPVAFADIERHDIFGLACVYAPGTGGAPRVIAREKDAFVKLDGEVIRFAADPGAQALPANTRGTYVGREYTLRLAIEGKGEAASDAMETTTYSGSVRLLDRWDREVYNGSGQVQCGA